MANIMRISSNVKSNDRKYIIKDGVVDTAVCGGITVTARGGTVGTQTSGYYLVQANYDQSSSIKNTNTINLDGYSIFIEMWMPKSNQTGANVIAYVNDEAVYTKTTYVDGGWANSKTNHIISCYKFISGKPITSFRFTVSNNAWLNIYNIWMEKIEE